MKSQSAILTTLGVAVIMLVIGVALGSVAFPMTKTETITQVSTMTATQSATLTEYVLISGYVPPNHITISGTCTLGPGVVFTASFTTVTYIKAASLAGYFNATITTVTTSTLVVANDITTTVSSTSTNATGCPVIT